MSDAPVIPDTRRAAQIHEKPPFQEWSSFIAEWPAKFAQGEHVTLIGPTGSGKTLLAQELVACRNKVVALGIKPKDTSLSKLTKAGWVIVGDWHKRPNRWGFSATKGNRIILWPKDKDITTVKATHRKAFAYMLGDVWERGGWCIWTDELRYLTDIVRMKEPYVLMYVTGRSNNISLVSAAQRPSHVPLEAYSQAQHLFLFRTGDERDLIRMGGLNGNNARRIAMMVAELPKHHFLYVNLNDGSYVQSTLKGPNL